MLRLAERDGYNVSMLPRTLEPEVMDTAEEAVDYDAMDHSAVNRLFVDDLLAAGFERGMVLDVGTGTAQIPIELASRNLDVQITAIDLSAEMLAVARRNVTAVDATDIALEQVDAKRLPYPDDSFDCVMSNSIVHHIPDPSGTFAEMLRVLRPGGLLFVRDLLRPKTAADVEWIVAMYAGDESCHQQQLLRQSLHAALSLDELCDLLSAPAIDAAIVSADLSQTSDRHWTLVVR